MTTPGDNSTLLGSEPVTESLKDAEREGADLLYSGDEAILSGYRPVLTESFNRLRDRDGLSAEQTEELLLEASRFYDGAGIQAGNAVGFQEQIVHRLKTPLTDEEHDQWQTESRRLFRERYGDKDGDRRLQAISKYVSSFPAFRKWLEDSGMGSNPKFLMTLAERAYDLRPRRK